MIELKREIYQELLKWKQEDSGKVLEIEGARQVGKTYILNKFAKENYSQFIYVNMLQTSGRELLQCFAKATEWELGQPRPKNPLHDAFVLFEPDFQDTKETVVVIDEIQESAEVYSKIRQFARDFSCHFIVTGSYLGKTLDKEYFLPAGDMDVLIMETLSYEEFLDSVGKRGVYETVSLYGDSAHSDYEELKEYYRIYTEIGGYPAVVKKYLETKDVGKCREVLRNIIRIFIDESERYFNNVIEIQLFDQIFSAIAQSMIKEKKGSGDLVSELSSILFKEESNRLTKTSINQAIAWLYRSHIVGYCNRVNECNMMDVSYNTRFYFRDVGLARYFLKMTGADPGTVQGIVSKNFVYLYLERQIRQSLIAGNAPAFGTYKGGEIDFYVRSLDSYKDYAIEVKAGNNQGKTARQILLDKKVERVYYLKGDTYGGLREGAATVPIYLTGRIAF